MSTLLTNATLLTEKGTQLGSVMFEETVITHLHDPAPVADVVIDCEGDFVMPGLIEMHTDNLEKCFVPRPQVHWPDGLAAILTHDSQVAAAGITTVYDAICLGFYDDNQVRSKLIAAQIDAITQAEQMGMNKVEHYLHLRCEVSTPELKPLMDTYFPHPLVRMVSIMDHTPGQRQWRDLEKMKIFYSKRGQTDEEIEDVLSELKKNHDVWAIQNRKDLLDLLRHYPHPLASHDDTTEAHVAEAIAEGVKISEFPTTLVAARAARLSEQYIVAGAPNLVRGGSHSGNVAAKELIQENLVDLLSSDYMPVSLLSAAFKVHEQFNCPLEDSIGMITWNPADALKLSDRGRLQPGLRADLLRVKLQGATPWVRQVWSAGQQVIGSPN